MGPLGIKLVGRARPLDQLALMRAILTSRGIKLPIDEDAHRMHITKVHLVPRLYKCFTCYAFPTEPSVTADNCFSMVLVCQEVRPPISTSLPCHVVSCQTSHAACICVVRAMQRWLILKGSQCSATCSVCRS